MEGSYFVDEPPEFTYESGLFHIHQKIGDRTLHRVMRPHTFMLALRRAAEAARKHRMGGAAIIPFPVEEDEATAH